MLYDVIVYNGLSYRWLVKVKHWRALRERAWGIGEWVQFRFEGQTYYRTFENHIYMVERFKRHRDVKE